MLLKHVPAPIEAALTCQLQTQVSTLSSLRIIFTLSLAHSNKGGCFFLVYSNSSPNTSKYKRQPFLKKTPTSYSSFWEIQNRWQILITSLQNRTHQGSAKRPWLVGVCIYAQKRAFIRWTLNRVLASVHKQWWCCRLPAEALGITAHKERAAKKEKKGREINKQFNTSSIMTIYFLPWWVAAWSLQGNDKWILFNILLEPFFLSENILG